MFLWALKTVTAHSVDGLHAQSSDTCMSFLRLSLRSGLDSDSYQLK